MKCGPDECPIRIFSDLTPAEQRVERKRSAEKMTAQGFTQAQIAKQLGVSRVTITNDLEGLSTSDKPPARPKGGRPKGSGKRPKKDESIAERDAKAVALKDAGLSVKEVAAETDSSERHLGQVFARENRYEDGFEDGKAAAAADPEAMSKTTQEKIEIWKRQEGKRMAAEFEQRVQAECQRRIEATVLPHYNETYEKYQDLIKNRQGVIDRKTYNKILQTLHPDKVAFTGDVRLIKQHEEAFRIFTGLALRLMNEKENPTETMRMPTTYADLMAMKAKATERRKAQRTNGHHAVMPRP